MLWIPGGGFLYFHSAILKIYWAKYLLRKKVYLDQLKAIKNYWSISENIKPKPPKLEFGFLCIIMNFGCRNMYLTRNWNSNLVLSILYLVLVGFKCFHSLVTQATKMIRQEKMIEMQTFEIETKPWSKVSTICTDSHKC